MADVFISYAREDRNRTAALAETLSAAGFDLWFDERLAVGDRFEDEIDEAIAGAKCVLVLWSERSVESDWVRAEATEGLEAGKLIPVKIDDVRLPLSFRRLQTADLVGWPASEGDLDGLVTRIGQIVGKTTNEKPDSVAATFGREDELARLNESFRKSKAGGGRVVTISGEPGIGKTHLVRAFAHQATRQGAEIMFGNCYEEPGSPPYWPWTQVLEAAQALLATDGWHALADDEAELISRLVPSIGKARGMQDGLFVEEEASQARFKLFNAVVGFLVECSAKAPLVIVLDDLHWADRPSMRLLEFLAREIGQHRILLVCTYRDVEITRSHPLFDTLGALAREAQVTRLRLRGISKTAVERIVETTVGHKFPPQLLSAVHQHTEGNPLFATEVARVLAEELAISGEERVSIRIPDGVKEAIGRRLNRLSVPCNQLLSEASVLGRRFTLPQLRALSDVQQDTLLRLLEEAISAGLLEAGANYAEIQFTHAMIRSTLYEELPMSTRLRLHQSAGSILEELHADYPGPALAQIAQHFYVAAQAGNVGPAVRAARRAGEHADRLLAYEEAVKHYEMALDAAEMSAEDLSWECAEMALALGVSRYHSGRDAWSNRRAIELALGYARRANHREVFINGACQYFLHSWTVAGPDVQQKTIGYLDEALRIIDDDDLAAKARLLSRKAVALKALNHRAQSESAVYEAIELARRCGNPEIECDTLAWAIVPLRGRPEKLSERIELGEEALGLSRGADTEIAMQALKYTALGYQEAGDQERVKSVLAELRTLAQAAKMSDYSYTEAGLTAYCALMEGAWDDAMQHAERALNIGKGSGDLAAEGVHGAQMFLLHRELGNLPTFAPVLEEFLSQGHRSWLPGLAMLFAELGEHEKLRTLLDKEVQGFRWVPRDELFLASLAFLSEAVFALRDEEGASELYQLLLPYAGQMMVHPTAVCYGPADLYLGMLASVMNRRDASLAHFDAARAQCEFAHSEPWSVRVDLRQGQLLLNTDPSAAKSYLDRCRERAERFGMRGVVALLDGLKVKDTLPDDLTPRELDVLRLMAVGRSNKDIAKVLDIGLSTVATHVRSILAKTYSANRTEAAAYARAHNLDE
jgi:predicted ATPase/DNA-binding CsgD family transcriptional regulator